MNCTECDRRLRTRSQSAEDYPGTVEHSARGMCAGCYGQAKRRGALPPRDSKRRNVLKPKPTTRAQCQGGCGRQLRPEKASAEDFPGTLATKAQGRCSPCYMSLTTERRATPQGVAATASALDAYLAWRRPYRAKAGAL